MRMFMKTFQAWNMFRKNMCNRSLIKDQAHLKLCIKEIIDNYLFHVFLSVLNILNPPSQNCIEAIHINNYSCGDLSF